MTANSTLPDNDAPLFLFGTLRHDALLALVAGKPVAIEPATLQGYACRTAHDATGPRRFPLLSPEAGAQFEGILAHPDAAARARLDAYEQIFGYAPEVTQVVTAQGPVDALIYQPAPGKFTAGDPWDLEAWIEANGAFNLDAARDLMFFLEKATPEALSVGHTMCETRVASRNRAREDQVPTSLRRAGQPDDVDVAMHQRPYSLFFGVEETDLRFRRFDGSLSPLVKRAGFIMGDAVTVMPYDPVRDRVMIVEQFRYGPYARGDRNCWSLEPIAGRIDPFETPEDAAHREAMEETSLSLSALHPVGRYYVSPGAVSEYLYSYVGLADLPQTAEGVGGLETEAEDIRAHVISFDRLMELLDTNEAENGPLLITAQWLALNRTRLRHEAGITSD